MPRVQLPDGARTVAMDGSDRYTAGPGDTVNVSRHQVDTVRRYAARGPVHGQPFAVGTKAGRRCPTCRWLGNAWNVTCSRCGTDTELEVT